jgi:hypothetical protein
MPPQFNPRYLSVNCSMTTVNCGMTTVNRCVTTVNQTHGQGMMNCELRGGVQAESKFWHAVHRTWTKTQKEWRQGSEFDSEFELVSCGVVVLLC